MVDVFDGQVLNRVVDNTVDRTSFLVDTFFPEVQVSDEETILFDVTTQRKLITPFVSPLAEAKLTSALGYETDSFRPAYLKDKRAFDPKKGFKRVAGETIGGALTPQQRVDRAIKANLGEQIEMLNGRFEVMAGDVLVNGTATISGENYPTRVVDFRRRGENRVVKTGAARWGQAGVSPFNDVDYEAQEMSDATGYAPTDVVMTVDAWRLYQADLVANHKDSMDTTLKNLAMTEVALGYVNQPRDGVTYRGKVGYLRFWTYSGSYTDPETGNTTPTLPAYTVLIGGASIDGVRHFGAIQDHDAGIQARQYFVKSWTIPDPSRRILLMQSAPLLVPYRINNIKSMKVN
jgi:hypothetical protein